MKIGKTVLRLALIFVAVVTVIASADKRDYVWTYGYGTLDRGEAELEHYITFSTPEAGLFKGMTTATHNFELEVGMNERWDFGVYQNFKQSPGGSLEYTGFKLRSRYRIGEKNQYFMDPLLYVEYKNSEDFSKSALEVKFVLSKDIGKWNISLNPYFELEQEDEGSEFTPKYAAGLSYALGELFRIGVETKGAASGHYIGPTISHGSGDYWFGVGTLFAIGDVDPGKAEFQARAIFGFKF
jgi:hypothetical protein